MIDIHEDKHKHYSTYKTADDKNPVTGYYLTIAEYNEIKNNLSLVQYNERQAKSKLKELEDKHKSELDKIKEKYYIQLDIAKSDIESEYRTELMAEQEKRIQIQKSADTEAELNRNLKRIARERANKKRNINKHEPGYYFLDWKPTTYQLRNTAEPVTIPLYIINIQTPWDCSLSLSEVDKLVTNDILDETLHLTDKHDVGILNQKDLTLDAAIEIIIENNCSITQFLLTRKYRSNVKTGLWEVALCTGFEPNVNEKHRKNYV